MKFKIQAIAREKSESEAPPARARLAKKLVRLYDSKMLSLFYDGTCALPFKDRELFPVAEYAVGKITDSPTEWGLFCYPWKDDKQLEIQLSILRHLTSRNRYQLALLSVRIYGTLPSVFSGTLNCRSVYVKKIVWSDQ